MARTIFDVAVRTAVFIGIYLLFLHVVTIPGDDDGLGTGLLAFALFVLIAFVWGGYDGWHAGVARAAVGWLVVGALTGAGMELALWLSESDRDVSVTDLVSGMTFIAGLVAVPAVISGAIASSLRRPRPALPR